MFVSCRPVEKEGKPCCTERLSEQQARAAGYFFSFAVTSLPFVTASDLLAFRLCHLIWSQLHPIFLVTIWGPSGPQQWSPQEDTASREVMDSAVCPALSLKSGPRACQPADRSQFCIPVTPIHSLCRVLKLCQILLGGFENSLGFG